LAGACCADRRLAVSPNTGEALSRGLRDDSALVRSATVDFVGRLVGGQAEGLPPKYAGELRAAARAALADVAPGVRKAAFRVVCDALSRKDPALMASVSELLRRIRYEAQQVRDSVLSALEKVLLAPPLPEASLEYLTAVVSDVEIGGSGLRDLFTTHQRAHGQSKFAVTMAQITTSALDSIDSCKVVEGALPAAHVLVQVGLAHPAALYDHMLHLQSWLAMSAHSSSGGLDLAQQACRILSDILPSWAAQAESSEKKKVGGSIQQALTQLLAAQKYSVARGAMECLCVVARHVTSKPQNVLTQVAESVKYFQDTIGQGSSLDGKAQQSLCRHAWIACTAHEFLDVDRECSVIEDANCAARGTAGIMSKLLSAMCLKAPPTLRPLLVPCLGFLTRRHTHLLQAPNGPQDVFKVGLSSVDVGSTMQACTLESLAELLCFYEQAAEAGAPPSGVTDEAVAKTLMAPKVSEAVQRLGELQPAVLPLLCGGAGRARALAKNALSVVRSLSHLGVLHPSPAMSALVASSLAGFEFLAADTSRFLLKLVESQPQLLICRLGAGIREASALLKTSSVDPGSIFSNTWRFSTLAELCSEHFESKRMREQFLDALFAEVDLLGNTPTSSREASFLLERTELLLGLFVNLPYRNEFELAHILRRASKFLTLHTIPLLPDTDHPAAQDQCDVLGVCCASVLWQSVCRLLCSTAEMQRLFTADANGEADKPLSPGFARRLVPDENLRPLLRQLATAADNTEALVEILAQNVPVDSPLLKGLGLKSVAEGKARRGRKTKRGEEAMPEKAPKGKKRRASAADDNEAFGDALAAGGA